MNVAQVIAQARAWVRTEGQFVPGFCGAHLMGGILSLPPDAPFPAWRDVDMNIVVHDAAPTTETQSAAYNGLILEYSTVRSARYRTPEAVLADPELAANLAVAGILADPQGLLAPLQLAVAAAYGAAPWVAARCAAEQAILRQVLQGLAQATTPQEGLWLLTSSALFLSGLLAEATLRPPTHRRCLVVLRDALDAAGQPELYTSTLQLLGWGELTRVDVTHYLADCAEAFDRAVAVTRTPVPFQNKLQAYVRPYLVCGAQELIEQGDHREAMFWISGFLMFANTAIQADAPAADKAYFQAKLNRLLAAMDLSTPAAVGVRARQAAQLAPALIAAADALVARHTADSLREVA